ncbi:MAG: TolC family protein, partial [Cyclobacteriaceae bacterium]|nr:TolC family protein [Cyclobacteriaceae bacterium]
TLNTTSIYVKQASLTLLNANYSKQQALNQLKQWLELSVSDSLILSEKWPVYSIGENDIVDFNFPPDLELKLSQMQSAASQNAWQAAKAAYLPTLTAAYSFNTLITGNEFLNFNNTNNLPQQYWGLKLTVPLLSNGTRNFKLSKTRLEYDAARKRHESIAQETTLIDNNLITHYTAAREKLQSSSEILELYHNNDTHADLQFEAGQISMDTRLRVYQDYLSYKQEYLRNLADLYTRYAELKVRQQQL